jgi:hypothetical protein
LSIQVVKTKGVFSLWFQIDEFLSLNSSWQSDFSEAERQAALRNDKTLIDKTSKDKTGVNSKPRDDDSSSNDYDDEVLGEECQMSDDEIQDNICQKVSVSIIEM